MRSHSFVACLLAAALGAAIAAAPAFAEKGGNGKGKGNPHNSGSSHGNGGGGHGNSASASKGKKPKKFETSERSDIQRYYQEEFARSGNCPPGLAKKNNGCMPPGQAKRQWSVGHVIPHDVYIEPLPPALFGTLAPPLPGFTYGYVGGDVILYGVSDHVVIDFVAVF